MNVGVDSTLKLLTFVELEMLPAVDGGNPAPPWIRIMLQFATGGV